MGQFSGLTVLELASVLAGPSVGQFFAELGARVIKVENLKTRGDVTRSWKSEGENTGDRSAYFCSVNWGKESIAIDLSSTEGKQIVLNLAAKSDVVIASYKPGDAEKLGVDYQALSKQNPQLIYGQISGYGSANPRVGYDAVIQAEAGFMFMNGESGGNSLKMPVALVDVLASHHLKEGLLLALLERMKTGKGKLVQVSLLHAAVSSLVNQATNWLVGGKLPGKQGSLHPNIAPYGDVFKTVDGKEIILAVGSDQQFVTLCDLIGIPEFATDDRFRNNQNRVVNRVELRTLLAEKLSRMTSGQAMSLFISKHVPAGVINNMEEVFEMPEIRSMFLESGDRKGIKSFVEAGNMENFSHLLPPPSFGEHTDKILHEFLNYSQETLISLRERAITA